MHKKNIVQMLGWQVTVKHLCVPANAILYSALVLNGAIIILLKKFPNNELRVASRKYIKYIQFGTFRSLMHSQ